MREFLTANLPTIIAAIALAIVLALIIFKMHRDKKQGKSTCGCNCANCPSAGLCHEQPVVK